MVSYVDNIIPMLSHLDNVVMLILGQMAEHLDNM